MDGELNMAYFLRLILPLGPDDIYLKAPTVAFGIHDRTMLNLTEPCSEYPFFSLSAPSMSSKTDEMYSLSARGLSFMGCLSGSAPDLPAPQAEVLLLHHRHHTTIALPVDHDHAPHHNDERENGN